MRSSRFFSVTGLALLISLLAACGGSGKPTAPVTPPMITSTSLPQGEVNNHYDTFLQASGGSGTYTWSISTGSLPPGLTLNTMTAEISGTPTTPGLFSFTGQVTDGAGRMGSANLTITISGALQIVCNSCYSGTLQLPFANPGVPYSAMLSATGGPSNAVYNWCVLENTGNCDNGAGGALPLGLTITTDASGHGIISGTPTTPGTPSPFTIEVMDNETPPSRGSVPLMLTVFDFGPKTLQSALLNNPYNENISALGGQPPYTWTESGTLPPGLTFGPCTHDQRPSCPLTGTPTRAGTYQFMVSVTDGETHPATASGTVTITVGPIVTNATLNGNYAIAFTGFSNGAPYVIAGSIQADGMGNIISGLLDHNDGHGSEINDPTQCRDNPNCPVPEMIQTGSVYDLSIGNGTGSMTLMTKDHAGVGHTYQFQMAIQAHACVKNPALSACGQLIQSDPTNPQTYGSGLLKVQDSDYFSINAFFPVNMAVLPLGIDPAGNRYAAAGAIGTNPGTLVDVDCNANGWGLSGCPLDENDHGSFSSNTVAGTFSADLDSHTGRGAFINLRFPNDPNGNCTTSQTSCGFAYYIVNKEEMLIISGDPLSKPANLTLWTANRQRSNGTGWQLSNISGASAIELTALDPSLGKSDVTAGLFNADGAGNSTFNSDENDGGTLNQQQSSTGTYALSGNGNKTGRFTLTGFSQFGANGAILYLYNGNYGYVVGTDAKVTSGVMETQTGSPFSDGSFNGNYEGGTRWPAVSGATNSVAYLYANGIGNVAGSQFTSGPGGPSGPNSLTLTYQVDSTGRTVVMDQNQNIYGLLYVVSPTKVVMVPSGNDPALNVYIAGQPD